MALPIHALKSGAASLPRYFFLTFFVLVCCALSQKAQAQGSITATLDSTAMADEGTTMMFNITFGEALPNGGALLDVRIIHGNPGTTGFAVVSDLGRVPQTVPVGAGVTTFAIPVEIASDFLNEGDETFELEVTERVQGEGVPVLDFINRNRRATGTIINVSTAVITSSVSISPTSPSMEEGETFTFTVALSAAVNLDVMVAWEALGSGANSTNPADLAAPTSGTVTITTGQTEATITIVTNEDTDVEEDETFTVTLLSTGSTLPMGVTLGTSVATATITNDDEAEVVAPPPAEDGITLSLSTSTSSVPEGQQFTFVVTASEAAPAGGFTVFVDAEVDGSGSNPAVVPTFPNPTPNPDISGSSRCQLTFDEGDTRRECKITAAKDELMEEDETFIAMLTLFGSPSGVEVSSTAATVVATITNVEGTAPVVPPTFTVAPLTVSILPATPSLVEGETLTLTVVSGTPAPEGGFEVDVRLAPSGANPATLPPFFGTVEGADIGGNETFFNADFAEGETMFTIMITATDDMVDEPNETFTATIDDRDLALPEGWSFGNAVATVRILDEAEEVVTPPGPVTPGDASALIQPRLEMASTALRRHAARFGNLTSTVVHNRLNGHASGLTLQEGAMAVGGESGGNGAWLNASYAKFNGDASGRQADIYAGVDLLDSNNNWLFGALIGYEPVDLDLDTVSYEANYTHFGFYGGMRVSDTLMLDGAISYGTASPDISMGDTTASYDADRFTVRAGLTGDLGIEHELNNGVLTIAPELRILYTRESLDGFTDSAGGVAGSKDIELGRLSIGPRLTWSFVNGSQVVGGIRAQWDFSDLDDEVDEEVSGAANVGLRLVLAPNVDLGLYGDVDGIGISNEYITYGGRLELNARF